MTTNDIHWECRVGHTLYCEARRGLDEDYDMPARCEVLAPKGWKRKLGMLGLCSRSMVIYWSWSGTAWGSGREAKFQCKNYALGSHEFLKKTSMVKLTVFCPLYSDLAVRTMLGSTSYFPRYNCYCYSATVFSVTFYAVIIVLEYFIFIYLGWSVLLFVLQNYVAGFSVLML
jgi:hypothetical protein